MSAYVFRLLLAVIGLLAFALLLLATVSLAQGGQPVWAAFTGTGAVALCSVGLYKLLLALGQAK